MSSSPRRAGTRKPRLLVTASTFPRWPGDREPPFVFELSRRLAGHYAVHILAPHAPGAKARERLAGVHVIRYRYAPGRWQSLAYDGGILAKIRGNPLRLLLVPGFFLGQWLTLRALLRTGSFDLVHAHWIIPQGILAVLGRPRPSVVCTSHGGDLFALRGPIFRWLKALTARRSACMLVVSSAMKGVLAKIAPESRIEVISMGADLTGVFTESDTHPRDGRMIFFAGRLVQKKGVDVLIRSFPYVLEKHPKARLHIAGDGPEREILQQLAASLGVDARVKWLGAVEQRTLASYYQRAAMVIMPSVEADDGDQEGLGLVMVEALGCGCPVVASDLPAIHDVIEHGRNGLLVPQKDPQALAGAVNELLESPSMLARLGAAARASVFPRFDWSSIAERHRQLFDELIKR